MTDYSHTERVALCDLLDRVGPDQPTLCAGWSTHDLVAHLYVRESDPLAGPSALVPALAESAERRMQRARERFGFGELVDRVRSGPPKASIYSLPVIGRQINTPEYLIHHEDVRRAVPDFQVRALPAAQQENLWKLTKLLVKPLIRKAPSGVVLRLPDGRESVARKPTAAGSVTVTGEPAELMLFCSGRQQVAQVDLGGDPEIADQLRNADFGT